MKVQILAEREGPEVDRVSRLKGRSAYIQFGYLLLPGKRLPLL